MAASVRASDSWKSTVCGAAGAGSSGMGPVVGSGSGKRSTGASGLSEGLSGGKSGGGGEGGGGEGGGGEGGGGDGGGSGGGEGGGWKNIAVPAEQVVHEVLLVPEMQLLPLWHQPQPGSPKHAVCEVWSKQSEQQAPEATRVPAQLVVLGAH